MTIVRWLLLLVFVVLCHPAMAQPGPTCAPNTNSVACQAPAVNMKPTDILLGQQATGPTRTNQAVQVTPQQVVNAASGGTIRTCPLPLGLGQDDEPNLQACIAQSNQTVIVPPGTYTIATQIPATATFPTDAIRFSGLQNVTVYAYGATFTIAPTLQNTNWSFVGFMNNSKNIVWKGGILTGATTRSPGGALDNGMCWENVTNLTIADVTFNGNYTNGSAICGVFGYEVTLDNLNAYGVAIGVDNAWDENLFVINSRFWGAGAASIGMNNFSDPVTHGVSAVTDADGSARSLKNGLANNLQFINNTTVGFHTGLRLDGVNGAAVIGNTLRDGNTGSGGGGGVLLETTNETESLGFVTQNINLTKNIITNNGGVTPNVIAGIILATDDNGLKNITIEGNAIYDNCGEGITAATANGMGQINIRGNDFNTRGGSCSQTAGIDAAVVEFMGMQMRMDGNTGNGTDIQNIPVANSYDGISPAGGFPGLRFQQDKDIVLMSTNSAGAPRTAWSVYMDNDTAPLVVAVPAQFGVTSTNNALTITPGATPSAPLS